MAGNTSRRTKTNRNARPRSVQSNQYNKNLWMARLGRKNAVIAVAFLFAFGGLGLALLNQSSATSCVYIHLYPGSTGQCVKDAELMLYNSNYEVGHWSTFDKYALGYDSPTSGWQADGSFGCRMRNVVGGKGNLYGCPNNSNYTGSYQYSRSIWQSNYDGSIGQNTWKKLCQENAARHPWVYANAGCAYI